MNLGNALEAPNEGDWDVVLEENYFEEIANAGFDAVRIPVRWSTHAADSAPYTIDATFFSRVDWAIDQALSRELLAVLDFHHFTDLMAEPEAQKARFLGMWRQIAERYQNYAADLIFEVLNEPHDNLTATLWNAYLIEAINVIRETNPGRTLIIDPADWGSLVGLQKLQLPAEDRNIIVTFHYYNPFFFTHQGADWVNGSDAWLGIKWSGTASERLAVDNDFQLVKNWAQNENRPIYMGEFGAYEKADLQSRGWWTMYVVLAAQRNEFSWAYWDFIAGFGAFDSETNSWNQTLLDALMAGK
ncbi:MAG: glycoside hydrolase family 5 protein [Calditrichaeota bacterium]|nr:MAG: glycoside hydrolase family 5 protein [Calditrichota bacterium]